MRVNLRKIGNSFGVLLPKRLLDNLGLSTGDEIEMTLKDPKADERRAAILAMKGMWKVNEDEPREWVRDKDDRIDEI